MNAPALPLDLVITTATPGTALVVSGELRAAVDALILRMEQAPAITDAQSFDGVVLLVREASALRAKINAQREIAKSPFFEVGKAIDAAARAAMTPLEEIITEGKAQEAAFLTERDRLIAQEAERTRLAELAARQDTSRPTPSLLPAVAAPVEIEAIKAPITNRRVVRIIDAALIPDEYWVLNQQKLDHDVLHLKKKVPGVEEAIEKHVVAR